MRRNLFPEVDPKEKAIEILKIRIYFFD